MTVPKIYSRIFDIPHQYDCVLLDAYGVFWGGNDFGVLPGSIETMENLISKGKIVGVLSNSTQLASKEIDKLHRNGIVQGKHFHFMITSGELARDIFLNKKMPFEAPRKAFSLFCGGHPKFSAHEAIFKETGFTETNIDYADFVYIAVPHINGEDQLDPEVFRMQIEKIRLKNLPMVCANPDLFAHEGNPPRPYVRQGSIARIYEELGGQVFYIGKPHRFAYMHALEQFNKYKVVNPNDILMVGDTPETDIRGAKSFGMSAALLTQTGIMAERIVHKGLRQVIEELSIVDSPHYFMERF